MKDTNDKTDDKNQTYYLIILVTNQKTTKIINLMTINILTIIKISKTKNKIRF